MRVFTSGATRDKDDGKFCYAGFLSPQVLRRYAAYMHQHRIQADGKLRSPSNWKKGIPQDAYLESAFRHFMDWWEAQDKGKYDEEAACALLFNISGSLHEELKRR